MKIDQKELRMVPNVLCLIRLASVPIFVFFILFGGLRADYTYFVLIGLGVFLFAASTDMFDGHIARKYNMVTELGKFLDPFADKVMHVSVILSLVIIGYVHWAIIVLLAVKELTMIILASLLINRKIVIQANFMGKLASILLSAGVIVAFFIAVPEIIGAQTARDIIYYVSQGILALGIILTYTAFFIYLKIGLDKYRELKENKGENDSKEE
ncbi:MAG: CDP-diacylglycerol--glycerol-3-phosphate 3-phosphatidyltransferase [Bacillota bacterium]|jgi:CDP-diacylglycerol--glycerol-3-phosphate 3-phosphatidyltransferase|nr:CDP-diacylglycerol--glycerol-3-phosphate 3-phosphatidyltransferase [Bacillota bacterium]HHU43257.1 CDP-diacylglycerol--glycerol-3-phosphate 3-phosphatidyltransferase [Clostridiales bacterium]